MNNAFCENVLAFVGVFLYNQTKQIVFSVYTLSILHDR